MDYEKDIVIDESALDVEFLEQPRLMIKYCQHAEKMKREADYAKERLDVKGAELDRNIRSQPDLYGIPKVTEAVVQNAILMDADYQQLSKEFIEAKYEANMASAAVRAFDQRKVALENLVRLHGQQYFAGPRIPRNLTEEREARQKRSDERVSSAMRRNKKKKRNV